MGNVSAWQKSPAVTIDAVTKYYHHGGARVAMRQGGEVYYLHGDHLGSTSLTTDDQGSVVHEARYLPFGEERWVDGEGVTDFTYTGQRDEAGFGLHDYNARFYSSRLGRFISPDSIVPDFANPQSLNRLSYVVNNPVKHSDPTGHDPLDTDWETAWRTQNCENADSNCVIPDTARQERLYSLTYVGPVSHLQNWSSNDWTYFYYNRDQVYRSTVERASLSNFTAAIDRLAGYYSANEKSQFVSAIALLYAGWPYDPSGDNISDMAFGFQHINFANGNRYYPNHGMSGFATSYHSGRENTHHYAGHLLLGFHTGTNTNYFATFGRELAQNAGIGGPIQSNLETEVDILMGLAAGELGNWLASSEGSISQLGSQTFAALKVNRESYLLHAIKNPAVFAPHH